MHTLGRKSHVVTTMKEIGSEHRHDDRFDGDLRTGIHAGNAIEQRQRCGLIKDTQISKIRTLEAGTEVSSAGIV